MSFTVDARTILELGRELISSDEVALYELIKNSLDAESPNVVINVWSQFMYTDYIESLDLLRELNDSEMVTNFIQTKLNNLNDKKLSKLSKQP